MKRKYGRACTLLIAFALLCHLLLPSAVFAAEKKPEIKLNVSSVSLFPSVTGRNTYTLKAKVSGTLPGKVKYMSSNRSVARVSKNGVITATGAGTAVITAYTMKAKASCRVQCYNASLKLNSRSEVTLKEGKTHKISVTTAPKTTTVTYSSSAPDIASVTSAGLIKALKPGKAVITIASNGLTKTVSVTVASKNATVQTLTFNTGWEFAGNSIIHTGVVKLYRSGSSNGIVVAVNAGHGTQGGESVRTLCHPDGSPKVTGGSTAAGSVYATAVSSGMQFLDGTPEGTANLSLALLLRDRLLNAGFDVLMIRETADNQLDNIARTIFANQYADCHIALHYDSSSYDKGAFYIGVPAISSYRNMYPVSLHWQKSNLLGENLIAGMQSKGVKIYGSPNVPMDLTQTSYSKIPSIDLEVGDAASDHSVYTQSVIADGVVEGVKRYFGR